MSLNHKDKVDELGHNPLFNNIEYDDRFRFVVLEKKYIDEVIHVFTHTFCDDEPMTQYVHMEYQSFIPFAEKVVNKAVADKLSIIALDKNNVAGLVLTEDLMEPLALDITLDPKFNYIFSLLESLGGHFFANKRFMPNQIAHLFITAISKKYRGHGLSRQINFKAMDLASCKNFSHMYCEFTNFLNELGTIKYIHTVKRLIGSVVYKEYEYENIKPFANLGHGASSYLWELEPNASLIYTEDDKKLIHTLKEIA